MTTTAHAAAADHPYAEFLQRIEKPVRYLGGEHGAVRKPWDSVRSRFVLAFPDLYDIGMSHLGFKILYGILNDHPHTLAERAYAPWSDMERELRARNLPLVTLESARPLRDFDVVGFSLQFELTYTNVLLMLELGGIPLHSDARGESDPLVVAGGPTATHGEPLAPFIDAFVIGDGEHVSVELALTWSAMKDAGVPRAERLRQLALIEGVYVPSLYATETCADTGMTVVGAPLHLDVPARVRRAFVPDLEKYPFPSEGPVAATETVFDRISVEIARGCTEGCRFCQAGMIYRPVRERTPESIVETIANAVKRGGYDEASLTSLSTADFSCIAPLIKKVMAKLEGEKVSLSVSSLRAYGLEENILDELQKVRATGLTFAPEAGTQRMRDVVNKNITEEQLMETAERVFSRGWAKMKLYFMIGLPTETDEDVIGIVETGQKARDVGRRVQRGRGPTVLVSVSTHVPKPHTPFQWCAMDNLDEIARKQSILRERARATRTDLRLHASHGSTIEGVLSRGDRRLAPVLEHAYRNGARFDSWEERLQWPVWQQAFEAHGVDTAAYLGTIPTSARLPWDHLDVGLEDGFLLKEYRKAVASRLSPPCGKAAGMFVHHTNVEEASADHRKLVCYDCGVACDLTQMREERLVTLSRLGALDKPAPRPEPTVITPQERRPRANFQQGEARRVRLAFQRVGRAAYVSHLDLLRLVPRVFRRAEVSLYYSQGFHPKPEMVFGPALALGITSLEDYVDLKFTADLDLDALPALLQPGAPEGLVFTRAMPLRTEDPALSRVVTHTRFVAGLSWKLLRERGFTTREGLVAHVNARVAAGLKARREVDKGLARTIDVAGLLESLEPDVGYDVLERAGIAGELFALTYVSRMTDGGSVRPVEVLASLFDEAVPARFVRAAMGHRTEGGEWLAPHEVDALRGCLSKKRPRPVAAAEAAEQGEGALAEQAP